MSKTVQVPDGWKEVTLGDCLSSMKSGLSRLLSETDIGIPVIRSCNIGVKYPIFENLKYWYIDDPQGKNTNSYILKDGDILINFINSISQIGKACLFKNKIGRDCIYTTNILRIAPQKKIYGEFLFLITQTDRYSWYVSTITNPAVNQASFTTKDFKKYSFPLPPLPEQKAIADVLSTWDTAIEKTERLIQAKEKRFKWLLRELISKPGNTQKDTEWKKVKIGSFLTESRILGTNGMEAQKITVKLYGKGVVPKDEKRIGSKTTQYYVRKGGQFIYSKLDFLNGAFGIIPQEIDGFESTLDLPAFDISNAVSKEWFLYYLIRPEYYTQQLGLAKGQRKARRVNPSEFLNSKILLPPLKIQNQIAHTLSTAQHEIDLLKQLVGKYRTQKRGLMQKLLTGEWRVKPEIISQYMEEQS